MIPIYEPLMDSHEAHRVAQCVESGWISSRSPLVEEFENTFAEFLGAARESALAVSSGSAALLLALKTLGMGQGHRVLLPSLTFSATASMVILAGATPVFMDVDPDTWVITPELLNRALDQLSSEGRSVSCVVAVHLYGNMPDMATIADIADSRGILLIEDAAEAHASSFAGKKAGTYGDAGTFSFFGNKIITTGEGGLVLFREPEHRETASLLRNHGTAGHGDYHSRHLGLSCRMTGMQAALGLAQMEKINQILERKGAIALEYTQGLRTISQVKPQCFTPGWQGVPWLTSMTLNPRMDRELVIRAMAELGIQTNRVFPALHTLDPYSSTERAGNLENSRLIGLSGISLPSGPSLPPGTAGEICQALSRVLNQHSQKA